MESKVAKSLQLVNSVLFYPIFPHPSLFTPSSYNLANFCWKADNSLCIVVLFEALLRPQLIFSPKYPLLRISIFHITFLCNGSCLPYKGKLAGLILAKNVKIFHAAVLADSFVASNHKQTQVFWPDSKLPI